MSNLIGQQINQYRIDALLGEGNMGSVYQAYDLNLARKVVLKVMHRQLARQAQFQQRFLQEAQAAARLDHPSIVAIYNFAAEPRLYIVMEYVAGPSLGEYVNHLWEQTKEPGVTEILRLVAQVASALDYAHEQGVIHRDIKPSNILLKPLSRPDRDGDPPLRAIVTDFGLAKLREGDVHTLTGTFMGTLSYMSPEQCMTRPLDGRSDIYSLGIVLYQLVTGQLPFDIKSPTDAIRMHVKETPPAPTLIRPHLPESVERIILQAIAKNPTNRFQAGNQMALALRRVAQLLDNPAGTFIQTAPLAAEGERAASPTPPNWALLAAGATIDVDRLVIMREGEAPRLLPLDCPLLTIGRNPDNDVVLNDKGVSRVHARLERSDGEWNVTDLGSTNGSYLGPERLPPDIPRRLKSGAELRIGAYLLQWRSAHEMMLTAQQPLLRPDASTAMRFRIDPGELDLVVNPIRLEMEAGDRLNIQVMLVNTGPIVEHVHLRLDGLPADWMTLSDELVQLMPGARGFVRISLHPPRATQAASAAHRFTVIATPMSNLEATTSRDCQLFIRPFEAYTADLTPRLLVNAGLCQVALHNQGNAPAIYTITGDDNQRQVDFGDQRWQLKLQPGQKTALDVAVQARRRPLLGFKRLYAFNVLVEDNAQRQSLLGAQLEVTPRLPAWLLAVLATLITLAALVGVIWLV